MDWIARISTGFLWDSKDFPSKAGEPTSWAKFCDYLSATGLYITHLWIVYNGSTYQLPFNADSYSLHYETSLEVGSGKSSTAIVGIAYFQYSAVCIVKKVMDSGDFQVTFDIPRDDIVMMKPSPLRP